MCNICDIMQGYCATSLTSTSSRITNKSVGEGAKMLGVQKDMSHLEVKKMKIHINLIAISFYVSYFCSVK
jgi:hypothetical protein